MKCTIMSLPQPSEEQQIIIDTASQLSTNITVDAVAGSGKTTLCMHIADRLPEAKMLILTYNKDLKADSRKRAETLGLGNVEVHTYHSLVRKYYGARDYDDSAIEKCIKSAHLQNYNRSSGFRIIVMDESQDVTDLLFRMFMRFYADITETSGAPSTPSIPIMLIGDKFQMIYRFKGADERYLTRAEEKYKVNTMPWQTFDMHVSFRVTQPIARFVNECMINEDRLISSREGVDVHYACVDVFNKRTLTQLISGYRDDEIMILAPSIKSIKSPVRSFANVLSNAGRMIYATVSDDSTPDQRDMVGKIAVLTFHQSKGLERKLVLVFGFDSTYFEFFERHGDPQVCPNTMYVACTRALEKLVVLHHNKNSPLPFLNIGRVKEQCKIAGTLRETGGVSRSLPKKFSVSNLCSHISFEQSQVLRSIYECQTIKEPQTAIQVRDVMKIFGTNRIETVSEITGTAVPMMFVYYLRGSLISLLHGTGCERIVQNAYRTSEYRAASEAEKREFHMDKILSNVGEFLMQANIYTAHVSGYLHKINQIKSYSWMKPEQAQKAIQRMRAIVSDSGQFEVQCNKEIVVDGNMFEISGSVDCIDEETLWEFKFVESLSVDHELQVLLYAFLTDCQYSSYRLVNIRNNEIRELVNPSMDEVTSIVHELIRLKITDAPVISEREFTKDVHLPERPVFNTYMMDQMDSL